MLGAILLILIGCADLARAGIPSTVGRLATIVLVWAGVLTLALLGLGIPVWWVLIPLALALLWLASTTSSIDRRTGVGIIPAVGVLVALLAFLVWDRTGVGAAGFIVEWNRSAPSSVLGGVPLTALTLGLGVALFAVESANIVVRAALRPTAATATRPVVVPPARSSWWRRASTPPITVLDLRGGRLIGPLERLLIIALTLTGALPIVAGLIAGKGIVRFPEISNDGANGSKAEYFLVGSLVSWAIALASAGLVWVAVGG